jgi:D-threo-aldose 1-dehydrogenase
MPSDHSSPRVPLPSVGVGTSPLGGLPSPYGYDVSAERAQATLARVVASPIRLIDTSNGYSDGEAERRVGRALREAGRSGDDIVLVTKADPVAGATRFDAARVRESFQESAARLGRSSFPLFHLHDPERFDFDDMTAPGGAVEGMVALRESGRALSIGVAGGSIEETHRYVDLGVFDVLLNHNHFTLLDRRAEGLIDHAVAAGMTFVNAAPYASGILAKPRSAAPTYQYAAPPDEVVKAVDWLHEECARFEVPLAALALQFSTRDPRVACTLVGVSAPERVDALAANAQIVIPEDLWASAGDRLGFTPPS